MTAARIFEAGFCRRCGTAFVKVHEGRLDVVPAQYCKPTCKKTAQRARKAGRTPLAERVDALILVCLGCYGPLDDRAYPICVECRELAIVSCLSKRRFDGAEPDEEHESYACPLCAGWHQRTAGGRDPNRYKQRVLRNMRRCYPQLVTLIDNGTIRTVVLAYRLRRSRIRFDRRHV